MSTQAKWRYLAAWVLAISGGLLGAGIADALEAGCLVWYAVVYGVGAFFVLPATALTANIRDR